jgi:hypothetical protein
MSDDGEPVNIRPDRGVDLGRFRTAQGHRTTPSRRANAKHQSVDPRYVQLTEIGAKAGFEALGCPAAIVWFEILYRAWKAETEETPIELGNMTLSQMGVSRWVKYRALVQLERAELIRVVRRTRKSVVVELLKRGCIIPRKG